MAKVLLLLFGIIILQRFSKAAPSEPNETPPILTPSTQEDVRLDSEPKSDKKPPIDTDMSQNQRQKRYYDIPELDYSYDFPPSFSYPSQSRYSKRDGAQNTAVYGEDPLNIIFRRLHSIVRDVRYQSAPRPVQPAYIPFVYIPSFQCGCNRHNQGTQPSVNPATPQPLPPTNTDKPVNGINTTTNTSTPSLPPRGSFDDKTQNWGVVTDKPVTSDVGIEGNGNRPINFDPIPPEEPFDIPVPPVEHGTIQAGAEPAKIPNPVIPPKAARFPDNNYLPGAPGASLDLTPSNSNNFRPTLCDGAILNCCNQPVITDKCFEALGCQDPTIYGSPCDPKVQLSVINKFQIFQKRRAG